MSLTGCSHQNTENVPVEPACIFKELPADESELVIQKAQIRKSRNRDLYHIEENRFFKGLLITLPINILIWCIIIFVIKVLTIESS